MKMKNYIGSRRDNKIAVVVIPFGSENGYFLNPRHDLRNHSPDGFDWGYPGSGPAQLALAILADFFEEEDDNAINYYQYFKRDVISAIETDVFMLRTDSIFSYLQQHFFSMMAT